jgi:retron-type reverse transcriptase
MTKRKTYDLELIRTNLFSKQQHIRLETVEEVIALPKTKAKPLLKEAICHWDRRLREAAAKAVVIKFKSQSAPWVINSARNKNISIKLAVRLLAQCDCNSSAKYLRKIINFGNQENSERAFDSITNLTCEEAIFFRWEQTNRLTPKLKTYLDKISDKKMESFVRCLSEYDLQQLLDIPGTRSYLKKRDFEELHDHAERTNDKPVTSPKKELPKKKSFLEVAAKKIKLDANKHLGWIVRQWNTLENEYSEFEIPKKAGGIRKLSAPSERLKFVQGAINDRILIRKPLHRSCHGFRRKKSIITNAKPHTGKDVLINIDLKDFFPSISGGRVYGIFVSLGFDNQVARFLTRITTYKNFLPQGAPTSPALANLVCRRLDSRLAGLSKKLKARYTRYADDITFSGKENIITAIPLIRQIIKDEGFMVAEKKARIIRKGNRQEVTGLTVNQKVSVPRHLRRRIRAIIHRLSLNKKITWKGQNLSLTSLQGHISYLNSVHPELAQEYKSKFPKS